MHIHVIHENAAWLEPLAAALDRQRLPWRDWFLDRGVFDLSRPPPEGVFYNRMSASSHTRDHRYAAELTAVGAGLARTAWPPRRQRQPRARPRNQQGAPIRRARSRRHPHSGHRARCRQGAARRSGACSASRGGPFILKPNRGGKGLGVRLFHSAEALADYLDSPDYEPPVDGMHLLQQYVRAPVPLITRAEFIGGQFHLCGRGRHQRGVRAVPGRCLRGRRCLLPGRRASPAPSSRSSTTSIPG